MDDTPAPAVVLDELRKVQPPMAVTWMSLVKSSLPVALVAVSVTVLVPAEVNVKVGFCWVLLNPSVPLHTQDVGVFEERSVNDT